MFSLTIIPTFYCQYKCNFCFHKDRNIDKEPYYLPDDYIKSFLEKHGNKFDKIIISGGEPMLYPKVYFDRIVDYAKKVTDNVVINTFPTKLDNYRDDVNYLISYDFVSRPHAFDAWNNMLKFPKKFDVVMTLTPQLFSLHPNNIFKKLTLLKNINSVELKPFIKLSNLSWKASQDYCDKYMKAFISSKLNLNYMNINKEKIKIINGFESNYKENDMINYCLLPNKKLAVESYNDITEIFEYKDIKISDLGIIKPAYKTVCDIYSNEIINHGKLNV
jgi:sulfatase maturation enzyme AslB (radical SAM superfamily)